MSTVDAYTRAQRALADLKSAVLELLHDHPQGLTNASIGRALGIYAGHVGHEGHISRTILAMLEADGVASQDEEKKWFPVAIRSTEA